MSINLRNILEEINSWDDFCERISVLPKKEIGDLFEIFTKYYFKINPVYSFYENIWLLKEVPQKVLEYLGLPSHDLGIDLIAQVDEEYHAIQCKFHSDRTTSVNFKEVSTFLTLLEGNSLISQGYICSSADSISANLKKVRNKRINLILSDNWSKLDFQFFQDLKNCIDSKNYKAIQFEPKEHQLKSINDGINYFKIKNNSRGKLILPCGAGKSLTGFWMMLELNSNSTIVAVPSLALIKQTLEVYLREIVARNIKVKWLCVCSDESLGLSDTILEKTENLGIPCETNLENIKKWIEKNRFNKTIIFTTYQSGKVIADATQKLNFIFDVGIFDEAHKTVGSDKKLFSHLLFDENIIIKKRIFMTATERFYAGSRDEIISMDRTEIYGEIFSFMSFKDAILKKLLVDYKIITIDIKKSEIASIISNNKYIQLEDEKKNEVDARSLSSMIALRKAMDLISIKKAISFHSSIRRAEKNCEIQKFLSTSFNFKPIESFTVSSRISTSMRNRILEEYAKSPEQSLITNARCLSEGVDIPGIDCVIFADPKKSKIDIVQSIGRALRTKNGKKNGYIILPLIYDDELNQIDNESFEDIISVIRGLASNDERIIEYFKDIAENKKSQYDYGEIFDFSFCTELFKATDLIEQIQVKIWDKLNKLEKVSYLPFHEAREFVHSLKLTSSNKWRAYFLSGIMPTNIPKTPNYIYDDWIGIGDWLGTNSVSKKKMTFEDFEKAREFVRKLKLKNTKQWLEYTKSGMKPDSIPSHPQKIYKNKGYTSIADWLGSNNIQPNKLVFLEFEEAKKVVKSLNLKSGKEWHQLCEAKTKPDLIPRNPEHYYIWEWKGWNDFLSIN
jgi:predicted helicase